MNVRKLVWALLTVTLLGSLAIGEANAFWRRAYAAPYSGAYSYPLDTWYGYGSGYDYGYGFHYNPYVAPLPAYGILPPPLATWNMLYGDTSPYGKRTTGGGGVRTQGSLYPSPAEAQTDRRRVRFEITVPNADAVVKFDGAATKQKGLKRVFVTSPLQEDKEYSVTIEAQWPYEDKILRRQKTFTVVAGETVQHTFVE